MYLLKPRRQDILVSSTFLWEQVLREMEASRPWQRLKRNLLLLLQLLAAAFLVMALVRPYFPVAGGTGQHLIAILDCSASMMATDIKPSRFEEALRQAGKMVDELGAGDEMTIISMGPRPRVLASATGEKSKLRQALKETRATTGPAALEPVLSIVSSLARGQDNVSVVIFSDGNTLPASKVQLSCPVKLNRIGKGSDNLALTTLATRKEGARSITLARVQNFGDRAVTSNMELWADQALWDVRKVQLGPGEVKDLFFEELPPPTKTIEARLTRNDFLDLDNRAFAVVDEPDTRRVLLVSEGNIFLEKALALPGMQVFKTEPGNYRPAMGDYQLYVFDGWLPSSWPEGGVMVINPGPGNPLLSVKGKLTGINQMIASREESLFKYVDVNGWQILQACKMESPAWARTVLEYEKNPLLMVGERNYQRVAVFAFDLHDSNIPLQTGFPILINNLAAWLLPATSGHAVLDSHTDSFQLAVLPTAEEIWLSQPGEEEKRFKPPFPQVISVTEPGLYKVTQIMGEKKVEGFLVKNIAVETESDIKPCHLPWSGLDGQQGKEGRLSNREVWPWLAWVALLLLLVEWEVYRRGY